MISTKNIIGDLNDVPKEWVFEFYLKLPEKLTGQSIKIKSIFNSREKTPSMYIYMDNNNNYKYKDFSSGYGGDGLSLVQHLFNYPTRGQASFKIIDDYNEFVKHNEPVVKTELKAHSKYKVTDYQIRHWNNFDQAYWQSFKIGSKMLEYYNVAPLEFYEMTKEDNLGVQSTMKITNNHVYGYFRNDGTLYKIYQPKVKDNKFIKVRDYIQGSEQLRGDKSFLIITSSLKDLMAFNKLKIKDAECIAPDSENSMIPTNFMVNAIRHYKNIFVLFDNDEAGIKAAEKYKSKYGFEYVVLELEKDLSDSIKTHGVDKVRDNLLPLLKQTLL